MKTPLTLPVILFTFAATLKAETFDEWRAEFFTSAQMADPAVGTADADPDGDGQRNFTEYVLRGDPWTPASERVLIPGFTLDLTTNLPHLSATFRTSLTTEGTLYILQVIENFGTRWRADQVELRSNGLLPDGRFEYLAVDKVPAHLPERRFIRLLIAPDGDQDGLPDDWELALGLNPNNPFDAMNDIDGDGDSNLTEFLHGTDPYDPDDNSRQDEKPRPPRNVRIVNNPDGTRDVV